MFKVPLIDISPFGAGQAEDRRSVANLVDSACRDIGFFAITGHGVQAELVNNLREASHKFFELPIETKRRWAHPVPNTPRGYRAFAEEGLGRTKSETAAADLKEFYHFGPDRWPNRPYYNGPEGKRYFIPNLWPSEPPELKTAALEYYRAMESLSATVLAILATALELPASFFEDKTDRHVTAMRLNYYPLLDRPSRSEQFRAGAHTDYGAMTILMGEDGPGGLQVRTADGHWTDVQTRPDFFIVNIGDLMMRWSNDRWLSNLHRVVTPPQGTKPERGRLSVGYFHQPNYDAIIECLPSCATPDHPARYPPVQSGRYRDRKYEQGNQAN